MNQQRVERGVVQSEHIVQLFDDQKSLAERVSGFLSEAFERNGQMLLAITPKHWESVARRLRHSGYPVDATMRKGRLIVVDAAATLDRFMRNGWPDAELFDEMVGGLVRKLLASGVRLDVYGEMVDLLAAEGDFKAAHRLEGLWNDLAERNAFRLFCGYSANHFGDPRTVGSLRQICDAHTRVQTHPSDRLGSWLVGAAAV